jgi:hypothetical protein
METLSVHGNSTFELSGAVQITGIMIPLYRSGDLERLWLSLCTCYLSVVMDMIPSTRDLHDVVAEIHQRIAPPDPRRAIVL